MAMQPVDVAIVGAGIFGLCAAWACAARGKTVRVYEATHIGAGSSGGVVGALSPHMPEAWNPKKAFQLNALLSAQSFWQQVAAVSGLPTGYGRVGRIIPLHTARAADMAQDRAVAAQTLWQGAATFQVHTCARGLSAAHGVVAEDLTARLYPALAISALARALQVKGVEIVAQHPVAAPDDLPADQVIIAAGHQTRDICPEMAAIVRGVKGQAALLDYVLPADMPVLFDNGLYVIGHGARGTAVGSTSENTWDHDGTDAQLDDILARAALVMPALSGAKLRKRWSGIRPRGALPDPVVGQISTRAWVFTGGFKIGFGIAHTLAADLAAMMDGVSVDLPDSFHLDRHRDRA